MTTPRLTMRLQLETRAVRHILLAEDDEDTRRLMAARLRGAGHAVVEATDGADAIDRLEAVLACQGRDGFDVIVTDVDMPGLSGLDVLAALRCARWTTPVILVTAYGDAETVADAAALGAATVLHKPIDPAALEEALDSAAPA